VQAFQERRHVQARRAFQEPQASQDQAFKAQASKSAGISRQQAFKNAGISRSQACQSMQFKSEHFSERRHFSTVSRAQQAFQSAGI
jgi:hypothetical protein